MRSGGRSIGLKAQGGFHTSHLKEYPPPLCKAIAQSVIDSISATTCGSSNDPFEHDSLLKASLAPLDPYMTQKMLADFHGFN